MGSVDRCRRDQGRCGTGGELEAAAVVAENVVTIQPVAPGIEAERFCQRVRQHLAAAFRVR
jgi:hypothetical protein